MIAYIRKLFTSLIFGFPPPKISDISFKKRNYKWSLNKGKLYKVKENVSFALRVYDTDKCLFKTPAGPLGEQYIPPTDFAIANDILLYIDDVKVSEHTGEDKHYVRPLFLKGDRLYIPQHDIVFEHYASDVVHSFNEVLEEVQ